MASPLRKSRGNTVIWALMALIMLGLAGFGVTNFSGSRQSIATVGDEEIGVNDYAQALQSEMRAMSAQVGQPISIEQAQTLGLDQAVLAQLLASAALDGEAGRLGLSAGDDQVRTAVMSIKRFQGVDGSFDREAYRLELQNQGLTEVQFEDRVRRDIVRSTMQSAVAGGAAAPQTYVKALADYVGEERDFVVAELLASDLPEPVAAPDEAAVKAYYDANPDTFTRPEVRRITYVWLSPEMVADTVEVDESELKAAYDARIADFVSPERRLVEQLVFPTVEDAAAAKARIDAGQSSFEDEVVARGLTLADVDLGDVSKDDLGPAGDAVFALTAPGVTGPVETSLGPALIAMNGILEAQETTFEEARPDLETEARLDRARRLVADKATGIEDTLASGASLEDVAKETGMEIASIDYSADATGGIAGYEEFRKAAEAVTENDFPELGQLDDGGVFALRLDGIDPPAVKPLDEVRDEVVAAWTADETHKRLVDLGNTIVADVAGGGGLVAKGLVTTAYSGFLRSGHLDGAPPEVVASVFATDAGKAAVVDAGGRVHVVQVLAVTPADPAADEQKQLSDAIAEQARQGIAQDIFTLYAQAVEAKAGITINQGALAAVNAQIR